MKQISAYSGLLCGGIYGRKGLHSLPLARIKKIMKKPGEDVKMMSEDTPIIFSKACELFVKDITQRGLKLNSISVLAKESIVQKSKYKYMVLRDPNPPSKVNSLTLQENYTPSTELQLHYL
ncbi:hypothetical protein V8G54_009387 [Vigna mungo]|uniref:Transcription factor CBF/NF-Y/archaeal histone domain-containing protein n=1 Tax=Vigna mungo TaxID=3915 RepID=A0AAQ3NW21_VIGMU